MDILVWSVIAVIVAIVMGLWVAHKVRSYLRRERKEARIRERESGEAMLYHDRPRSPCRHVGPDTGTSAPPDSEPVSPSST